MPRNRRNQQHPKRSAQLSTQPSHHTDAVESGFYSWDASIQLTTAMEHVRSDLQVLSKHHSISELLKHGEVINSIGAFVTDYNDTYNRDSLTATDTMIKLRCQILRLLIDITNSVFSELEQDDVKSTTPGEAYADLSSGSYELVIKLCAIVTDCSHAWSLNCPASVYFSTARKAITAHRMVATVVLWTICFIILFPFSLGMWMALFHIASTLALLGPALPPLFEGMQLMFNLKFQATALLKHLTRACPSITAAIDSAQHQQSEYLSPFSKPDMPLNHDAVIHLPNTVARILQLWACLIDAQHQHGSFCSAAVRESVQPVLKLALRAVQDWPKAEAQIEKLAAAILQPSRAERAARSSVCGLELFTAMMVMNRAKSYASMFKCSCCENDSRDVTKQFAIGTVAKVSNMLAQAICAAKSSSSRHILLPKAAAVQRLSSSCPEASKLLLLNIACAVQHLHACKDGNCSVHIVSSCSSSSGGSSSSSKSGSRKSRQHTPPKQQQQKVEHYHDKLLTALGLQGFEPRFVEEYVYCCNPVPKVLQQALEALVAWHFPAECSSISSRGASLQPWERKQQLDADDLTTDISLSRLIRANSSNKVPLPKGVHLPLLRVLIEVQLLQPTLETMHDALWAMQLIHEQFMESLGDMVCTPKVEAAMKGSADLLKPLLLSLGSTALQVAATTDQEHQQLTELVIEQLAVLIGDVVGTDMCSGDQTAMAVAIQQQPATVIPVLEAVLRTGSAEAGAWQQMGLISHILESFGCPTGCQFSSARTYYRDNRIIDAVAAALAADHGQQLQQQLAGLLLTVLKAVARHRSSSDSGVEYSSSDQLPAMALPVGQLVVWLCQSISSSRSSSSWIGHSLAGSLPLVAVAARSMWVCGDLLLAQESKQMTDSSSEQGYTTVGLTKAMRDSSQEVVEWLGLRLGVTNTILGTKLQQQLAKQQQQLVQQLQQHAAASNGYSPGSKGGSSNSSKDDMNGQSGLAQLLKAFAATACAQLPVKLFCNNPACLALDKSSELVLCGRGNNNACNGCHQAKYCSAECQKQQWEQHKPICKALRTKRQQ